MNYHSLNLITKNTFLTNKKADKAANDALDDSPSDKRSSRKKKENLEVGSGNKKKDKNNICFCVICKKVADDEAIECTICKGWIHYSCSKLPCYQLTALSSTERLYSCEKCVAVDESVLDILESSQSES